MCICFTQCAIKRKGFLILMQCYKHLESTFKSSFSPFFFLSVSVPIEEKTHRYFQSKHDNIKRRASNFLFFCLSVRTGCKPLRFIARDIGRGSQRPRAGPLRVWARLAKTKTWECLAFLCLQTPRPRRTCKQTPPLFHPLH